MSERLTTTRSAAGAAFAEHRWQLRGEFEGRASLQLVPHLVSQLTYPLSEVPEAICYLKAGHARGKIVIAV